MEKHRTVDLLENVLSDLDDAVWPDAEDMTIEGGVVDLAPREPVRSDGLPTWMPVWQNVRRVEQLGMGEAAHCTSILVRDEHPLRKGTLMHAL